VTDKKTTPPERDFVCRDQLPTFGRLYGHGLVIAFMQMLSCIVLALFVMPVLAFTGGGLSPGAWVFTAIFLSIAWLMVFPEVASHRREIGTAKRAMVVAVVTACCVNACVLPLHFVFGGVASGFEFAYSVALYGSISFLWTMSCWGAAILKHGRINIIERGACLHCGYDLTGNQSGQCPECGAAVEDSLVRGTDFN